MYTVYVCTLSCMSLFISHYLFGDVLMFSAVKSPKHLLIDSPVNFAWILDLRNASRCQNWMGTSTENSIFDVILLVSCRFSQETIWCQKTMVSCKIFPHTRSQVTNPLREMHRRTSEIRCSPSWPSPLHTLVAWLVRWVSSCLNMVDLSPFLLILMVNMRVLVHSFFLSLILRPNYMRVETNISTPIFFCKWEHRNT